MATTASVYNASRTTRQVLKRHRKEGPSLILHLYGNTFRFERQNGAFLCDSPLKNLLHFIRDQKVPADLVDVFDEAQVPFFEGCLIIEIHDHRQPAESNTSALPSSHLSRLSSLSSATMAPNDESSTSTLLPTITARTLGGNYGYFRRLGVGARHGRGDDAGGAGSSGPNVYRVVLYPTAESLWRDLRMLDSVEGQGMWSDEDVLQIESRILALTSPPLCLSPDPQATRIANLMLSATALPASYAPLPSAALPYHRQATRKRGINSIEVELDRANKRRREKVLRLMERGSVLHAKDGLVGSSSHAASFSRIGFIERWRAAKAAEANNVARGGVEAKDGKDEPARVPAKKKKKKGKVEEEPEPEKEPTPPPPPKKKASKKKAQREKEEREKLEREKAEKEQAEREAAAAKAKEEEIAKKPKKMSKKKEKELAAKKEAEAAAAAAAAAAAEATKKKRPSKSKKAKADSNPATPKTQPSTTPQQKHMPTPKKQPQPSPKQAAAAQVQQQQQPPQTQQQLQQQQAAAQQALQQASLAMFGQQAMGGNFPMQGVPQMNGAGGFGQQFGTMNGAAGMMMPSQPNFQQQQQQQQLQLQQQLAIQRALQQAGLQSQVNTSSGGGFGMNMQHLQALLAMQQQQQQPGQTPQQQPGTQPGSNVGDGAQQQFNTAELPVGVGLNNLPPNWGSMNS